MTARSLSDSGTSARVALLGDPEPAELRAAGRALIAEHAADLSDRVERGAAILVCGSLEGISKGVHEALRAVLGGDRMLDLAVSARYRRDVYRAITERFDRDSQLPRRPLREAAVSCC